METKTLLNGSAIIPTTFGGPGFGTYKRSHSQLDSMLRVVSTDVPAGVTFKGSVSKGSIGVLKIDGRQVWRIAEANPRAAVGDPVRIGLFLRNADGRFTFLGICGRRGSHVLI